MKKVRLIILLLVIFSLTACGRKEDEVNLETPEKSIEATMTALKNMDLNTFNQCTDNYVATYTNWIGIPVETEYKIFNELLQPRKQSGKRYQNNKKLAEKIVENLSWEVIDIQEDGNNAEIKISVTNKNMADAGGNYAIQLIENMLESDGSGIGELTRNLWNLGNDQSSFISCIDATEQMCTMDVTVQLKKVDNGNWIVELSDEFINAFMGNIDSENYSEDIEKRLESLEDAYEEKLEKWAGKFEDKVEGWFD